MQKRRRMSRMLATAIAMSALVFGSPASAGEMPTLERAIQLARAHSIAVVDAEGELGVANSQMAGARQSILGNPYTDIQIDRGSDTGRIQALSYTYFPLDVGGQRGARIDEADRLIAWRKIGLLDARSTSTGNVVAAYGEMTIGVARVAEANAGEATAREEAKYFAGRLEAKDTTLYEKSLSDAEVARWVQSRAEAELRLASARARFSELTGLRDVTLPAKAAASAPPALRGSWDDAHLTRVVDRAPIIARLTAERGYWESSAERYRTERFPPISLEIIGGRGSAGETRYGGGLVFTFPVTRRFQGEIARAEHGQTHAERQLAAYRTVLESRLRAARDAVQSVSKAVDELDASGMPALEKAVSALVDGYKLGKIELTRVLLARRDLATARARRLDLLEAAWRAYADLTILSGDLP